jgi:hypothetical protein
MIKIKKYEQPQVRLIELTSEGLLCGSFTGAIGGEGENGSQNPGYNEEQFPW